MSLKTVFQIRTLRLRKKNGVLKENKACIRHMIFPPNRRHNPHQEDELSVENRFCIWYNWSIKNYRISPTKYPPCPNTTALYPANNLGMAKLGQQLFVHFDPNLDCCDLTAWWDQGLKTYLLAQGTKQSKSYWSSVTYTLIVLDF